ncbi:hypothetical protein MBLNU230_g2733t1 [Neophaeotheca triangularis]
MANHLGKRKRRAESQKPAKEESPSSSGDDAAIRAAFQRAFEAKFNPVEVETKPAAEAGRVLENDRSDEEDSDDDWSGFSGDEEDDNEDEDETTEGVETVEFGAPRTIDREQEKAEKKAFMSSKPPSSDRNPTTTSTSKRKPTQSADGNEDGNSEATNLKHDLDLQRLLKEAHLLDPATTSATASTAPEGKARLKALDSRILGLGAKKSALEQERMPIAHRKGMVQRGGEREAKRRKEAQENGVILERPRKGAAVGKKAGSAGRDGKRDMVDGPSVGKFRNGMLTLSKNDVKSIEGRKGGGGGKKKGKRKAPNPPGQADTGAKNLLENEVIATEPSPPRQTDPEARRLLKEDEVQYHGVSRKG